MSSLHKRTLFTLRGDRSRTIKQADKGSCIVVQDTADYNHLGLQFLRNPESYEELETDPSMDTAKKANEMLDKFKRAGRLPSYTAEAHKTDLTNLREQRMYFLKKVHKTPHKLRPIVSCCSGPTQGLSKLTNTILSGYLDSVPSLVKNSTYDITVLEQLILPPGKYKNLMLATMDVTSLYPSIPQTLGINMALQQAIPMNPPHSKENSRKNMLREMLTLVIKENTFGFTDKHYKQLKGVVMGTPVAPTVANLFMAKVEAEAISSWEGTQPLVWLRFIDNILVIMESTPIELHSLVSHCNSRMGPIKYTAEVSSTCIDFLDITIFKGTRYQKTVILDIKPYAKAIDPHSFLHYSSAYHISIKRGVVRGKFIRTLRRSSSLEIFAQSALELTGLFVNRGYPKDLIKETTSDLTFKDRERYLEQRDNKTLQECTMLLRVRQHPAISSAAIYRALEDRDLPFVNRVVRPRPTTIGELITKASSSSVRSDYPLRSSKSANTTDPGTTAGPSIETPPKENHQSNT